MDLDKLNFNEGAPAGKLDLMGDTSLEGGLAGNVSRRFEKTAAMKFLTLPT
ncbi:hypothetical protein N806_28810 [Rhodococcus sp. P27]|nr:hypothetical protein N806_28810 [Rhodococcus sp. P27]